MYEKKDFIWEMEGYNRRRALAFVDRDVSAKEEIYL